MRDGFAFKVGVIHIPAVFVYFLIIGQDRMSVQRVFHYSQSVLAETGPVEAN